MSSFFVDSAFAQTYNDGPINLQARLREFNLTFPETDIAFFGIVGQPDDMTYHVWARDNADVDGVNWGTGTGCLVEDYTLPLTDWNTIIFNNNYVAATVPQFVDIRLDCWEDESPDQLLGIGCVGTRCNYDTGFCCGGVVFGVCVGAIDDDDLRCEGQPFATLDYRLGPPCQWYNHGPVSGTCAIPANDVYRPRIETFWRYTNGDACASAIQLGTLNPSFTTINHFNSNECYTNAIAYVGGGQDVVYEFNITQPIGLGFNTCGTGTLNSDILVLNSACNIVYTNSGACGSGSEIREAFCTPGTYYVVVEGRANDQGTFTLSVFEDPSVVVRAEAGPNVAVCLGLGDVIGAVLPNTTASGGMPGYTYNWTPNTFISATNIANPTAFPPVTTWYYVDVTDANGCTVRDSVLVTVNPGPNVNLGNDTTVCPQQPVPLDAGNGFTTYFWSTGSFNQTIVANQPGQYIAVVSDFNGCVGRDTIEIFNHALPPVNLGPDVDYCMFDSTLLNAGGAFPNYLWNTGAGTSTIWATTPGLYHVTVTDGNGCQNQDTINVTQNALPVVTATPVNAAICPGTNEIFNAGTGFVNYAWSNGQNNQQMITGTAGTYYVTVTDTNGCENIDSVFLTLHATTAPNITGPTQVCTGSTITLDATNAAFVSYNWNTGASTSSITVADSGIYMVTVTDANGCMTADTLTVIENSLPVIELGADTTICAGASVTLNPGGGFASYNWSTGAMTPTLPVSTAGTYYVTVTNGATCQSIDSITVSVSPLPVPNTLTSQPICFGDSLLLDPGPGFTTYAWNTGANSQTIFANAPGLYEVTVTNAAGCQAIESMMLSFHNPVSVNIAGANTGCAGTPVNLDAGAGFSSYDWSNGAQTQAIDVIATGTYTVTVTDANGCEGTASIAVTIHPLPPIDLGPDTTLCSGGSITLDAGAGFGYNWSTGANTQTINVTTTGTYAVTITDANNCQNVDVIDVVANTIAQVDLGPVDTMMCDSGGLLLDAGPSYVSYQWAPAASNNQYLFVTSPGVYSVTVTDQFGCVSQDAINVLEDGIMFQDFLADDTTKCAGDELLLDAGDQWLFYTWATGELDQYLLADTTGTYMVTVTDANGCRFWDAISVVVDTPATFELGPNINICPDETLELTPGGGFSAYSWSTGETSATISITTPGTYSVTGTWNNCTLTDDILIGDDCPGEVFIPNVFSPNNDGINDQFWIEHLNLDWLTIQIYDRWGKFLYESEDKNFRWDGRFKGNALPEGVYYYIVRYQLNSNENPFEEKGTVTILR